MTSINNLGGDADLGMLDPSLTDLIQSVRRRQSHHGLTLVLWVFRDTNDRWWVREEGGGMEPFTSREDALEFARNTGRVWGSYRIFIELSDGRVTQELFNVGGR
jgi:hypothetical protein